MQRCHLKGELGDRLHAVLCAAGYNIRWLLRMIEKKGVAFLRSIFLRLKWLGQAATSGLLSLYGVLGAAFGRGGEVWMVPASTMGALPLTSDRSGRCWFLLSRHEFE